jgi:hypothetical protein
LAQGMRGGVYHFRVCSNRVERQRIRLAVEAVDGRIVSERVRSRDSMSGAGTRDVLLWPQLQGSWPVRRWAVMR